VVRDVLGDPRNLACYYEEFLAWTDRRMNEDTMLAHRPYLYLCMHACMYVCTYVRKYVLCTHVQYVCMFGNIGTLSCGHARIASYMF
jgi:hypothetical protein